ncbi:PEP/pyruvate-binding domain-containing protein [Microbacterium aurum]
MSSTSMTSVTAGGEHVYPFDFDHGRPAMELADLLGGKGAGLAEMTTALEIDVPPGFTIALPVCRSFRERGWPPELEAPLRQHLVRLGDILGRGFGEAEDPLLVAVRSGSPVSMPGMLDTILNLGLNDDTVVGLAAVSRDEEFAWDSYRRFVHMFAVSVRELDPETLPEESGPTVADTKRHVKELLATVLEKTGRPVPHDPFEQLREAIEAVFRSWDSPRAVAYREREEIDADLGTAVNIQAMVFGNRSGTSGTGVAFTRDPRTGEHCPYGDYLPNAQGEDVVSGSSRTLPLTALSTIDAGLYERLGRVLRRLEVHYRDLCDVEFTIESGRLWFLQTRVGKRGALAAVRIASDMVDDPDIALSISEAVARVPQEIRERAHLELKSTGDDSGQPAPLGIGLGASGGYASGRAVFTSQAAVAASEPVILIRRETRPEDVVGMSVAAGVLTTSGGLVSHAAVVARGWGVTAVVGAHDLVVRDGELKAPDGTLIEEGDVLTIDGASGRVWRGLVDPPAGAKATDELLRIEKWAEDVEGIR